MDVTEALVRAAPEPLRFPCALLDQDIRKSRVQPPLRYRFTPPVFLLQYAAPVRPRPPLTTSYNALPETTQKAVHAGSAIFSRFFFISRLVPVFWSMVCAHLKNS